MSDYIYDEGYDTDEENELDEDIIDILDTLDPAPVYLDDSTIIKAMLIGETEKAWLLKIKDKQSWFPKSICTFEDSFLECPNWLLNKKKEELI